MYKLQVFTSSSGRKSLDGTPLTLEEALRDPVNRWLAAHSNIEILHTGISSNQGGGSISLTHFYILYREPAAPKPGDLEPVNPR